MKKLITSLLLLCASVVSNAEEIIAPDGLKYALDQSTLTAEVTGTYTSGRERITYQGQTLEIQPTFVYEEITYQVTKVGNFGASPNLEKIIIPSGIELSKNSFSGCAKLCNINLPVGMEEIPSGCFRGTAITDLSFLPSTITVIGQKSDRFDSQQLEEGAFSSCSNLESAVLPTTLNVLGSYTFSQCKNLETVELNEGLTYISDSAFQGDERLENIKIPSTVTVIDRKAFQECGKITNLSLPGSITFIGRMSFSNTGLTSIELPENLESVRTNLLRGTNVTSLTVPAGVKRIMPLGLSSITKLQTLVIADSPTTLEFDYKADYKYGRDPWVDYSQDTDANGVWLNGTKIRTLYVGRNLATWIHPDYEFPAEAQSRAGNEALTNPFYTMDALESITIGEEVTDASQLVFENYPALKEITLLATTPPTLNPLSEAQTATVKVIVPEGCAEVYRSSNAWSNVVSIIESASIGVVEVDKSNSDAPVYNLQGMRVDASSLPAGIYIKDGRKFIVR